MKTILHLCADTGSDTKPYADDPNYKVILVGSDIGVENFEPPPNVHGIIANPPCTEFSTARSNGKAREKQVGFELVYECLRIINASNPKWYYIENPARGTLKKYLGKARYEYEPWWYGSPWTKRTALWGRFNIPPRVYTDWADVPKLAGLYTRPNRPKPSLAFMHYQHVKYIPEFEGFKPNNDMEFRSLCSQQFAKAFKSYNP